MELFLLYFYFYLYSENKYNQIFCCECQRITFARLTDGSEIYPYRSDLAKLPFWKCDVCKNYVGCHHKNKESTEPLGIIPTLEIKKARIYIHKILDPLWKNKKISRNALYKIISKKLGYDYHTAEISSIKQARTVYQIIKDIDKSF